MVFGCGSGDSPAPSEGAGPVAGESSTARSASLDQVGQNAPAVLYFVKDDCGSNPGAIPLVQKVYAANAERGKFFVVMNTDAEGAARWSKDNGTTFPIIPDPNKEIIGRYGVKSSQTGVLVDADLKETQRFAGWGKGTLEEMNRALGGDGEPANVDLSTAPEVGFG